MTRIGVGLGSLALAFVLSSCAPSAPQEAAAGTPTGRIPDLVRIYDAFGSSAADMPPGRCVEQRSSSLSALECVMRAIVRMHVEDVDGDGMLDVRALRADGTETLYMNVGGRFSGYSALSGSYDWGDASAAEVEGWHLPFEQGAVGERVSSVASADLNGDGFEEVVVGLGSYHEDRGHPDHILVGRAPVVLYLTAEGRYVHAYPFDVDRRRVFGFATLVWAGDITGDLVPDVIFAGPGMLHPQLFSGTASPSLFGAVSVPDGYSVGRAGGSPAMPRARGPVTSSAPVSIGLFYSGDFYVRDPAGREYPGSVSPGDLVQFGARSGGPAARAADVLRSLLRGER